MSAEHADPDPAETGDDVDETLAEAEEFFTPRDAEGNRLPTETPVDGYGTVKALQIAYGDVEEKLGDVGSVAEAEPDVIASLLREFVVEPDLNAYAKQNYRDLAEKDRRNDDLPADAWFTASVVREMEPFAPATLLMALLRASGLEATVNMTDEGEARIELDEESEGN